MFIFLFIFGVFALFKPPVDPDFGWHYKYGEYLLTHGHVLRENIFSYTMADYRWSDSYWLFEGILYTAHHYLGSIVAGLLFSAILAGFMLLYLRAISKNFLTIFLVYVFSLYYLVQFTASIRPFLFSCMFILILLEILVRHKSNSRYTKIRFLPFLFLLWANLHADFLLGLFIFGCFCLKKDNWRYIPSLLFSVLATLINPFGLGLWAALVKELGQPKVAYVAEWHSNLPTTVLGWIQNLITYIVLATASFKFMKEKKLWWYGFICLFFLLFSIKSIYMLRVFVLVCLPALVWVLNTIFQELSPKKNDVIAKYISTLLGAYVLFSGIQAYNQMLLATSSSAWSIKYKYPYKAVQILKTIPHTGNLYNNYGWGGYLIWQLPEYKTFIDGRMAAWQDSDDYLMRSYGIIKNKPFTNTDLVKYYFDSYNIAYALDLPNTNIVKYLKQQGWVTIYSDQDSILLSRN